jgi:rare lipoprotein A (peptidoglycan hydrolase)
LVAAALVSVAYGQQAPVPPLAPGVQDRSSLSSEDGIATVYGAGLEGRLTASGEPYRSDELTAAHRTHPIGTRLRVIARDGNSVTVRVNDRWNGGAGRIVNLSSRAARELGFGSARTLQVRVEVDQPAPTRAAARKAESSGSPRETRTARLFPAAPATSAPASGSRSEDCAEQARILGLENEWAERHVRSCLANRPKKSGGESRVGRR